MLVSKSRDDIVRIAEDMCLTVTFDNPPDKVGFWSGDKKLTFEEIFSPILTGKISDEY